VKEQATKKDIRMWFARQLWWTISKKAN
jgi:hypothetical protein